MNVLYDHQTFSIQTYGGVSRYHAELIEGINQSTENQACISALFSNNVYLTSSGLPVKKVLPAYKIRGKGKFIYYANQLYSKRKVQQGEYDVFHPTYYDPYFLPYLKNKPFVVTFHDMIYEKFSDTYQELARDTHTIANKKILAEKATRIVAVSENTKKDIIDYLNISPDKIQVIYHGNSLPIIKEDIKYTGSPYLLFVGNRGMYKNFTQLLVAIHPLLKKYSVKLICAGGGAFTKDEQKLIVHLNVSDLVEQLPINDNGLLKLYQQAIAFIFPSLYEGFGIPILEAFACGCPCAVSNTSSLPEVGGDAALYFDPEEQHSIQTAVERLLCDRRLRQELVEKGRVQLNLFSWKRAVNETLTLYKALI